MENWIPFEKGKYLAEAAFLVAENGDAVPLEKVIVEVYQDPRGVRRMKGSGFAQNVLVVALLEEGDAIDVVLDMGGPHKLRLPEPDIRGGKMFTPDVRAIFQFTPNEAGRFLSGDEFEALCSGLHLLSDT
jgi:hypothetical protein